MVIVSLRWKKCGGEDINGIPSVIIGYFFFQFYYLFQIIYSLSNNCMFYQKKNIVHTNTNVYISTPHAISNNELPRYAISNNELPRWAPSWPCIIHIINLYIMMCTLH